jgi:hypothetical protein
MFDIRLIKYVALSGCLLLTANVDDVDLILNSNATQLEKTQQLLDSLQMYGRCAGQVATSMLFLLSAIQKKDDQTFKNSSSFQISSNEKIQIINASVTAFLLMVELVRFCHERKMHKQKIASMTHQNFMQQYPHLVVVQYQIALMKNLIDLSMKGSLPEQVFAILTLTKMALPGAYSRFAHKAAKKMYKKYFDASGNFVFTQVDPLKHAYKKFNKKVAQTWQQIALKSSSFADTIDPELQSEYALKIDTDYNNALIAMIHAGIKQNASEMERILMRFAADGLMKKLFDYYHKP